MILKKNTKNSYRLVKSVTTGRVSNMTLRKTAEMSNKFLASLGLSSYIELAVIVAVSIAVAYGLLLELSK